MRIHRLAVIVAVGLLTSTVAAASSCPELPLQQPPAIQSAALVAAGDCYSAANDLQRAEKAYRAAAIQLDTTELAELAAALIENNTVAAQTRAIATIEELLNRLNAMGDGEDIKGIIAQYSADLGDLLLRADREEEAIPRFAVALADASPLGLDAEQRALALNNQGIALESLGRYSEALVSYKASLEIGLPSNSENTVRRAKTGNNIGVVNWKLGDNTRAEEALRYAIRLLETTGDAAALASALNNLGLVLGWGSKYDDATVALESSMSLRETRFGASSLEVANSANNLGVVLTAAGRLDQAGEAIDRALAITGIPGVDPALHARYRRRVQLQRSRRGLVVLSQDQRQLNLIGNSFRWTFSSLIFQNKSTGRSLSKLAPYSPILQADALRKLVNLIIDARQSVYSYHIAFPYYEISGEIR